MHLNTCVLHTKVTKLISIFLGSVHCVFAQQKPNDQATTGAVPADKGTVSDSGKFEPALPGSGIAPIPKPAERLAELGLKLDGEKLLIGSVELDRKARTISIPAKINDPSNSIEYILVHNSGKQHEAILITDALPQDFHIACLLLGWEPKKGAPAKKLNINVSWHTNGPARFEPLSNLLAISKEEKIDAVIGVFPSTEWSYTGSTIDGGGFAAALEGSIIALINDPAALINESKPTDHSNKYYKLNAANSPPKETPVKVIFQLAPTK